MDKTHQPGETASPGQMASTESVSSAWMEVGSHGDLRFGVKVYDPDPQKAVLLTIQQFTEIAAQAEKLAEDWRKRQVRRTLQGLRGA